MTTPDRMSALKPPFGLSVRLRVLGTVVYGKDGWDGAAWTSAGTVLCR